MVLQSSSIPQSPVDVSRAASGCQAKSFIMPDLKEICPFKWGFNPHYEAMGAQSQEWINSFNIFSGSRRAHFNVSNMSLLGAYAYPHAGPEAFLACSDWLNVILVVDDFCDDTDGAQTRDIGDAFLDGLKGKPHDGDAFSAVGASFRARHFPYLTESAQLRLIKSFAIYLDSIVRESDCRDKGKKFADIEAYLADRRENGGYQTGYILFDFVQGTNLPDAVHESPIMKRLHSISCELDVILNDLYSYRMELSRGLAESNIMTVFMRSERLNLQEAADRVGEFFRFKVDQFLAEKDELVRRPFSDYGYGKDVDEGMAKTIESMELLCAGYIRWCLAMPRYFGNNYQEVVRTRIVTLQEPKETF